MPALQWALPTPWQWGHVADSENVAGHSPVQNWDKINLLALWDLAAIFELVELVGSSSYKQQFFFLSEKRRM